MNSMEDLIMKTVIKLIVGAAASVMMLLPLVSNAAPADPILELNLHPANVQGFDVLLRPSVTFTGTTQCPGVGNASFGTFVASPSIGINDEISFTGTNGLPVLDIAHVRSDNFTSDTSLPPGASSGNYVIAPQAGADQTTPGPLVTANFPSNKRLLYFRQDWTRIKVNPNGIDNATGIRHYIGNFGIEYQRNAKGDLVVTSRDEGVITVGEPTQVQDGPLAGFVTRTDAKAFIGPHSSWLEPFKVSDIRTCNYLSPQNKRVATFPIAPANETSCVVDSGTTYHYNGVTFQGNIVGCPSP